MVGLSQEIGRLWMKMVTFELQVEIKILLSAGEKTSLLPMLKIVLYEHPDVSVVQIIAMPDPRLQEKACAFISMKAGKTPLTLESVQAFLAEKGIAKQYWPEHVEVVDEFPRTPSGKIQKFRLREH